MDIPLNIPEADVTVRGPGISSFVVTIYNVCVMHMENDFVIENAQKHNALDVKIDVVPMLSMISFATKEDSDAFIEEFEL